MTDSPAPGSPDLASLTASLQSDARDAEVFFQVLCTTLEAALPAHTTVERDHALLRRNRPARRLLLQLGDDTFEAEVQHGEMVCRHVHAVHGVGRGMPYAREVPAPEWIAAVVTAVGRDAEMGAATTAALRSMVT